MKIEKISKSRFKPEVFEATSFGQSFADHMLIAKYKDGKWEEPVIMPYGNLEFSPALMALHYGQACFEGMKCFKDKDGEIYLFRPDKNFERINKSAVRLDMPEIPEDYFIDGLKTLLDIDREWVPGIDGTSLYLRPFIFASEETVTARSSNEYIFAIVTTFAPNYYNKPLAIKIETDFSRSAQGGVGFAKAAGNYAGSFYPARLAREKGYDQVIWTDDTTHTKIEEAGTMNVMLRIDDTIITAPTSERILNGVTRDSILRLANHLGIKTEVRDIEWKEMYEAHKAGRLKEVFGCGTAVVLNNFYAIGYPDERLDLPTLSDEESYGKLLKKTMNDIQYARIEDPFGWRVKIEQKVNA